MKRVEVVLCDDCERSDSHVMIGECAGCGQRSCTCYLERASDESDGEIKKFCTEDAPGGCYSDYDDVDEEIVHVIAHAFAEHSGEHVMVLDTLCEMPIGRVREILKLSEDDLVTGTQFEVDNAATKEFGRDLPLADHYKWMIEVRRKPSP